MQFHQVIALASVACVGCVVGTSNSNSDPAVDSATLAELRQYQSAAKINAQPISSLLGPFGVNYFVSGDVTDFRRVHPEQTGSGVTIAPGTVIVREILDDAGHAAKLTVMAKGPPGFDPTLGDWWFGVTDIHGTPLEEKGELQIGRLAQCHECHRERTRDDFLFGVPATM